MSKNWLGLAQIFSTAAAAGQPDQRCEAIDKQHHWNRGSANSAPP
jgi:hypothetical protein